MLPRTKEAVTEFFKWFYLRNLAPYGNSVKKIKVALKFK
jgi:hypothetical protein